MKIQPPVGTKASSVTIRDEYVMYLLKANMCCLNEWIRFFTCISMNIIYTVQSRTFYYSQMGNQNSVAPNFKWVSSYEMTTFHMFIQFDGTHRSLWELS